MGPIVEIVKCPVCRTGHPVDQSCWYCDDRAMIAELDAAQNRGDRGSYCP